MKRIVLALVVGFGAVLYAAAPAIAEDPTPKPGVTSAAPVVVTGSTDVFTTTPTARRGLLSRLRDRRTGSSMVTMPTSGTIVSPAPGTAVPVPMPMPKPGVTPAGQIDRNIVTDPPMVTTAAYTTTTPTRTGLFSRMRNRGTTTAVPASVVTPMTMPMSSVVPASGTVTTMPMTSTTMVMDTTTTTTRMGLLARLRNRR